MGSLKYVGRYPTTDDAVVSRQYVEDRRAAAGVSMQQVDDALAAALANRALKTYVDGQDATKALKTYVTSQDAKYLDASALGAANGLARLNASAGVDAALLDNASRAPQIVADSSWSNVTVSSTLWSSMGTIVIPDPGYKWVPWVFGVGFESANASGASARPDVRLTLGGVVIGYGTGAIADTSLSPFTLMPDQSAGARTGGGTATLAGSRGFGSGSVSIYATYAKVTVICMPAE